MRRITKWVGKYKDIVTLVLTFIGVVGGLVGLSFLIAQTNSLEKETQILSQEYEATYRPYIAVENIDIKEKDGDSSSFEILITVKNYGQTPAEGVAPTGLFIGEVGVKYIYEQLKTTPHNVWGWAPSVATSDYSISYTALDYPEDSISFPGKEQIITMTVDKSPYQAEILETKLVHILLGYSYGPARYYYLVGAELQNGSWTIVENRGN